MFLCAKIVIYLYCKTDQKPHIIFVYIRSPQDPYQYQTLNIIVNNIVNDFNCCMWFLKSTLLTLHYIMLRLCKFLCFYVRPDLMTLQISVSTESLFFFRLIQLVNSIGEISSLIETDNSATQTNKIKKNRPDFVKGEQESINYYIWILTIFKFRLSQNFTKMKVLECKY